jgi:ubiquinone biosynthesis protein
MRVQPQLILLQKTLLNVEGLGRDLYPELDLFKTARPILRQWMNERIGPEAFAQGLKEHWPDLAESLKMLPVVLQRSVRRAYEDDFSLRTESSSVDLLRSQLRAGERRRNSMLAGAAFFLGGVVWLALATQPDWLGWLMAAGGGVWMLARLRN